MYSAVVLDWSVCMVVSKRTDVLYVVVAFLSRILRQPQNTHENAEGNDAAKGAWLCGWSITATVSAVLS